MQRGSTIAGRVIYGGPRGGVGEPGLEGGEVVIVRRHVKRPEAEGFQGRHGRGTHSCTPEHTVVLKAILDPLSAKGEALAVYGCVYCG